LCNTQAEDKTINGCLETLDDQVEDKQNVTEQREYVENCIREVRCWASNDHDVLAVVAVCVCCSSRCSYTKKEVLGKD